MSADLGQWRQRQSVVLFAHSGGERTTLEPSQRCVFPVLVIRSREAELREAHERRLAPCAHGCVGLVERSELRAELVQRIGPRGGVHATWASCLTQSYPRRSSSSASDLSPLRRIRPSDSTWT